jgi:transposase
MTASGAGASEGGRRRRHWSDEDRARIVAECEVPGSSVSMVARRHDLNSNMLFTWRRQLRQQQCGTGEVGFVPAVIAAQDAAADRPAAMSRQAEPCLASNSTPRPIGRIEIVLGDCRRIIVDEDVSTAALARVIGILERR